MELTIRKAKREHLDLIGKKYGRLLVQSLIGYSTRPYGRKTVNEPVFTLTCDCGKIVTLKRMEFKYGNTKSCGCYLRDVVYERFSNNRSVDDIVFYKTQIMNSYIRKANAKGRPFELTYKQFDNFITGKCFYCGIFPTTPYKYKKKDVTLLYNGIDRINQNEGYTLANSVSCCKQCNFLKGALNKEEFLNQVKMIASHCGFLQQCKSKNWAKSVKAETANTEVIYN